MRCSTITFGRVAKERKSRKGKTYNSDNLDRRCREKEKHHNTSKLGWPVEPDQS